MIKREILPELKRQLKEYPIVTLLGPRQSGKTTLAKSLGKSFAYVNLEMPENRLFAESDPKEFLRQYKGKVIFDEIQRVPELLSYLQVVVDESKKKGQFILTGSHQLQLHQAIAQSLAGRTSILYLLPLSISELKKAKLGFEQYQDYIFHGFYPRIYDQNQRPNLAYSNYFLTYVEKDVRLLINLKGVSLFEKFMRLLAGRVGQIVDYSSLGNDVGVDGKTISHWISILEASFVIFRLSPYFENFGKRAIKSPKIYFTDVGLLSYLLGIDRVSQVVRDPLVGPLFENLIVIETLKFRYNRGQAGNIFFYRDEKSNEIDLLMPFGRDLLPIEIKSASTFSPTFLRGIKKLSSRAERLLSGWVVYNGPAGKVDGIELVPFDQFSQKLNRLSQ